MMTILITGANRGIGRALFDHYEAAGQDVLGTTRGTPEHGRWLHLDVTDPDSFRAVAIRLQDTAIDLLVCNAGVYPDKNEPLDKGYPAAMWAETFAVNVTGVFLTIQRLLPNLRAAKGKIAIMSSQMASDADAPGGSYIYRASKAAVLNLGRNLARDLASDGIPVGIYHPGWVRTEMGGPSATMSLAEAVPNLADRFAALTMATTGRFERGDGQPVPF